MLETLVASEGIPDLVQISGGEPTIHPQIVEILKLAKSKPIRHVMLNTNGIRIATDKAFVAELAALKPGFEVYLQFDSLQREALENLRGADLRKVREQALANLEEAGISTTLVCVVKKGVNDDEIGDIVRHALSYKCVRGITFQPVQDAGRNVDFDKNRDRMLLTDIRRAIATQAGEVFGADDIIPLPCNPDSIAIAYGLRDGDKVTPITQLIPKSELLAAAPNTMSFERYPELKNRLFDLLSLASSGERTKTRARRPAVLPAADRGAGRSRLRQGVSHRHRAIPGQVQFLRRDGEAFLHPLRHAASARSFRSTPTICSTATD